MSDQLDEIIARLITIEKRLDVACKPIKTIYRIPDCYCDKDITRLRDEDQVGKLQNFRIMQPEDDSGFPWGVASLVLAAVVIVVGLFFK